MLYVQNFVQKHGKVGRVPGLRRWEPGLQGARCQALAPGRVPQRAGWDCGTGAVVRLLAAAKGERGPNQRARIQAHCKGVLVAMKTDCLAAACHM